jgi:F1F0 ATPase subunit 2
MTYVELAIAFVLGAGLGTAYFAALCWNVGLYLAPGQRARAIVVHVVRLLSIGTALYVAVRCGAGVLLAATIGLLASRAVMLRIGKVR